LVAPDTKSHQILGRIITQPAPRLNVMDLKTLDRAARLAAPAVPSNILVCECNQSPELHRGCIGAFILRTFTTFTTFTLASSRCRASPLQSGNKLVFGSLRGVGKFGASHRELLQELRRKVSRRFWNCSFTLAACSESKGRTSPEQQQPGRRFLLRFEGDRRFLYGRGRRCPRVCEPGRHVYFYQRSQRSSDHAIARRALKSNTDSTPAS
jgi:hypothetical protein